VSVAGSINRENGQDKTNGSSCGMRERARLTKRVLAHIAEAPCIETSGCPLSLLCVVGANLFSPVALYCIT